jgi:hypothetical protein
VFSGQYIEKKHYLITDFMQSFAMWINEFSIVFNCTSVALILIPLQNVKADMRSTLAIRLNLWIGRGLSWILTRIHKA